MSLEKFILFIIQNNALIVQGLVGAIVLLALFLAYRSFLVARDEELNPGGKSLSELEEMLKKLLEKAQVVPVTGSGESTVLVQEINELKKTLEAKQTEIEMMKTTSPAAAAGGEAGSAATMTDAEREALEKQIKELQGKLGEYEIISEDIADLSHFKEENIKLQKELQALKSAAPAASAPAAPAAAAAVTPAPEAAAARPTASAEPPQAAAVVQQPTSPAAEPVAAAPVPAAAPEPPTQPTAAAGPTEVVDDDIMKEFAAAVEQQKAVTTEAPVAETISPEAAVAAASTEPAPSAPAPQEPAAPTATASNDPVFDMGAMDMDKMVAEAMNLEEVKGDGDVNALQMKTDPSKLAAEAEVMGSVKSEDVTLMNDFENFVKKG